MSNLHNTVDALIKLIGDGDEADRCFATKTLGIFKDKRAIPTLISCLRDEDIDVCIDAAEALGKIRDIQAVPALLESLKNDPDGEVKTMVTEALGNIDSGDVIAPLLELASGQVEDMELDNGDDWDDWWDIQLKSVKALGMRREARAIPVLKSLLDNEDPQAIEPEIYKALAQISGEGIDVLLHVLQTSQETSRRRAITALGYCDDPRARKILGRALKDRSDSVRVAAIESLSRSQASNYLGAILILLKDTNADVRRAALDAIIKLGHSKISNDSVSHISALISDENDEVRLHSLSSLNNLIENVENSQQHISEQDHLAILACLQHKYFSIQAAACTLLGTLNQHSALEELIKLATNDENHDMARREAINAISKILLDKNTGIREDIIKTFGQWIHDKSQPVRLAAISNLIKLQRITDQLPETAASPMDLVIAAARGELEQNEETDTYQSQQVCVTPVSIEQSKNPPAPQPAVKEIDYSPEESEMDKQPAQQSATSTLQALSMDNVEMTLAAEQNVSAEEQVADMEDMEEYREYLDIVEQNNKLGEKMKAPKVDSITDARYLSLRMLGEVPSAEAIETLIEAMDDPDARVRNESIAALGNMAQKDLAHNHPAVYTSLLNSLGRLITLMHSDVEDNRLACVRTLGEMNHRAAIPEIIIHLEDEDYHVRLHAVQALGKLCQLQINQGGNDPEEQMVIHDVPTEAILEHISDALNDKEPGVQLAAIESLLTLQDENELDKIVQIALEDQGMLTRRIGKMLRNGNASRSGDILLQKLDNAPDSAHRRFIIEMLEELYRPEISAA